ncbi:hypothetical protein [Methylobacterium iners]|jgi:hypothetical protein|uniref:Uncharacterized protein n=1 Tax=Methylobacterium iners TaxID=418707 RepID=A0ABQ4RZT2_9HYPH|nr:hypothetical protein [Methylobacterium iners]GJD96365.1 hypothetical protein OCOJLMKI_3586 [Methylobacterium iners]
MIVCPPPLWLSPSDTPTSPTIEGIQRALALSFPPAEEHTASIRLLSALDALRSRED